MKQSKANEILKRIYSQLLDLKTKDHTPDAIKNISSILDEYGSLGKFFGDLYLSDGNEKFDGYRRVIQEFKVATSVDHEQHDRFMSELKDYARHDIDVSGVSSPHDFYLSLALQYKQENPRVVTGIPPALWDEQGNLIKSPSIYSKFLRPSIQHQAEHFFNNNHPAWIKACSSLALMGNEDRKVISSLLLTHMAHQHITHMDERRLALRPFYHPKNELIEFMGSMSLLNAMATDTTESLRTKVTNFIGIAKKENAVALAGELIKEHILSVYQRRNYAPEHRTSTGVYVFLLESYEALGFDIIKLRDNVFGKSVTPTRSMVDILIDNLNPAKDGFSDEARGSSVIAGAFFEKLGNQTLLESDIDQDRLLQVYLYTKSSEIKEKLMETDRVVEVLAIDLGL